MTIKIKSKSYDSNSQIVITCGNTTQNITAPSTASELTVVLDVEAVAGQKVSFANTAKKKRFDISGIEIYSGDATTATNNAVLLAAVEQGDSTTRTITGITDKFYTVKDLTGGGTFDYKVKAIYADNTESDWSNVERVTLYSRPVTGLLGDVNLDGVVDVTDINILVNIVLGKEDASNYDGRAYINDDDTVDVTDINMVVNIVLGKGN